MEKQSKLTWVCSLQAELIKQFSKVVVSLKLVAVTPGVASCLLQDLVFSLLLFESLLELIVILISIPLIINKVGPIFPWLSGTYAYHFSFGCISWYLCIHEIMGCMLGKFLFWDWISFLILWIKYNLPIFGRLFMVSVLTSC